MRVSAETVPCGKPAPDFFLEAAARIGVPAPRCLVLEDSPHGIAGARAAGMVAVGLANPHSGPQDLSAADFVVPALDATGRAAILDRITP